jgi:hypothetical protein
VLHLKEPLMNKLSVFAAALVFSGLAAAQTPVTREAVLADLAAARANGELAALQGEKGVEARPAITSDAKSSLPAYAVLPTVKVRGEAQATQTAAQAADHGENAARELGDFPAPIVRRATALAGR